MSAAMWLAWAGMAGFAVVYGWVWERAGERGRMWLEWGLAALVAGMSAASVLTHEPWADELHAWLQAREMTVGELWREMAYEGHFATWHLVLHPFARLGMPVETMGWISWTINAAAVVWFARKAPLEGGVKAAAGLSCVFLYVNPVISRCYVLVPLALFGVASLWGKRDESPVAFGLWTALLANTHVSVAGSAGVVFLVYARENVFGRADGKGWKECGRQWAGLMTMAAGGALAVAQILPSLWKSSVQLGRDNLGVGAKTGFLFAGCWPWVGPVLVLAGGICLGVAAWRRDKGVFWVYAGSLAWFTGFSLVVYPAHIINRAVLWWPLALGTAWTLGGRASAEPVEVGGRTEVIRDRRSGCYLGVGLAVTAMGLGMMRPDMSWQDWREEYDSIGGACRFIAERYGKNAETWIDGDNFLAESAAAYLENLLDWRTGERADRIRFEAGWTYEACSLEERRDEIFLEHPDKEFFLAMLVVKEGSPLSLQGAEQAGIEVLYLQRKTILGAGTLVLKVHRCNPAARGALWMRKGMERLAGGDREGAKVAWARAARVDGEQWEAMNNLAWVLLEEGRVAEARTWIDRAMENEEARENGGVQDTAAAVRRAERFDGGQTE